VAFGLPNERPSVDSDRVQLATRPNPFEKKESRMNMLTRRVIRLAVTTMGLAGLFVAMNTVPGAATPSAGFKSEPLGRGTYVSHGSLALKQGLDIVTSRITLTRGGSSGWHSHPGGSIIIVQQGELTAYSLGKGRAGGRLSLRHHQVYARAVVH
jgi:hypothetical protein